MTAEGLCATLVRAPGFWEPVFQNPDVTLGVTVPSQRQIRHASASTRFRKFMKPHEVFMDRDEYGPNSPKAWDCGWGDPTSS
jgi:hypothetical protein